MKTQKQLVTYMQVVFAIPVEVSARDVGQDRTAGTTET